MKNCSHIKSNTLAMDSALIGRREELSFLRDNWDLYCLFGVYGLRSVGKSSLVKEFLKELDTKDDKGKLVVWVDMRGMTSTRRIYTPLFRAIGCTLPFEEESHWVDYFRQYIVRSELERFIIVFDNAEDLLDSNLLMLKFKQICDSLVSCNTTKVIITSTSESDFDKLWPTYAKLHVKPLKQEDAVQLLTAYAPTVNFGPHKDKIASFCTGLPLALLMVCAELENGSLTPEEMVHLLLKCRLEVLSQDFYPCAERIAVVYGEFLRRLSTELQQKMATICYIPGPFTLYQAKEIIGDVSEKETELNTIQPITRRHMMQSDSDSDRYDIHGLLRDCVQMYLEIKDLPEVRSRFCRLFSKIMKNMGKKKSHIKALCIYNLEQQNFQKLLTDVIYTNEDTYPVYMEMALKCSTTIQRFMGGDSFQFYDDLLRLTKKEDRPMDEACVRICIGSIDTHVKGRLREGEVNYRKAIGYFEDHRQMYGDKMDNCYFGFGTDFRLALAIAYMKIGWNLYTQARAKEAIVYLEDALKLQNQIPKQPSILYTISYLGSSYKQAGMYSEALKFSLLALDQAKRLFGTDYHPTVAGCYNNLGEVYSEMGKAQEAFEVYDKALHLKKSAKAHEKSLIISINNMASSLSEMGQHQAALDRQNEAMEIHKKSAEFYNDIKAESYARRGQILFRLGNTQESIECFEKALSITKGQFLFLPFVLYGLAEANLEAKHYGKAAHWIRRVFDIKHVIRGKMADTILYNSYLLEIQMYTEQKAKDRALASLKCAEEELERLKQEFQYLDDTSKSAWLNAQKDFLREKLSLCSMAE